MCLYVDTKEYSIAEEDITVYKYAVKRVKILEGDYAGIILHKENNYYMWWTVFENEILWVSPYRESNYLIYKPGTTLTDPEFQCIAESYANRGYCIFHGLHTFAWLKDAILRANTFAEMDGGAGVLKCVIPRGTKYWTDGTEYCSEVLEVKELIFETDKGDYSLEMMVKSKI